MRRLRPTLAPLLAGALAAALLGSGCARTTAGMGAHMDGPQRIAVERSMVALPRPLEEARLLVWREVKDPYLDERIVLVNDTATPRENVIVVHTRYRGTPFARIFYGRMPNPFTAARIRQRVADEFGDWAAVSPPRDRINRHGPYRYVTASGAGVQCVLAWQMIDAVASITDAAESYAVEYRVCDSSGPPEQLLAMFDEIRLQPEL